MLRRWTGLLLATAFVVTGCGRKDVSNAADQAITALRALQQAPTQQRQAEAAKVAAQVEQAGTPLMDLKHDEMVFVYRGAPTDAVQVSGGVNTELKPIDGTDLFYGTVEVPNLEKAVFSYTVRVNGKAMLDPWTKWSPISDGAVLAAVHGPEEVLPPELAPRPNQPTGKLEKKQFTSLKLNATRDVWVYTPPGYTDTNSYPVLLVADGQLYFGGLINTKTILDNLITDKKIPPMIAVGVASDLNVRVDEYILNRPRFAAYLQFMDTELLPWVGKTYSLDLGPRKTASLGLSNGGAWALYNSLLHAERSRGAILESALTNEPKLPAQSSGGKRFYVAAGTLDPLSVTTQQQLVKILQGAGAQVKASTGVGGHDGALSAVQLVEGLQWVWKD